MKGATTGSFSLILCVDLCLVLFYYCSLKAAHRVTHTYTRPYSLIQSTPSFRALALLHHTHQKQASASISISSSPYTHSPPKEASAHLSLFPFYLFRSPFLLLFLLLPLLFLPSTSSSQKSLGYSVARSVVMYRQGPPSSSHICPNHYSLPRRHCCCCCCCCCSLLPRHHPLHTHHDWRGQMPAVVAAVEVVAAAAVVAVAPAGSVEGDRGH